MEQYAFCKRCKQGFFYKRVAYHGRVRALCDKCKEPHRLEMLAKRVARHRAKSKPTKQSDDGTNQPVSVGIKQRKQPAMPDAKNVGMFAGEPEPTRSQRRRAVGLDR